MQEVVIVSYAGSDQSASIDPRTKRKRIKKTRSPADEIPQATRWMYIKGSYAQLVN
jgi:hypothetical protein